MAPGVQHPIFRSGMEDQADSGKMESDDELQASKVLIAWMNFVYVCWYCFIGLFY